MIDLNYGIKENMKMCTSCRVKLSKKKESDSGENVQQSCSRSDDPEFLDTDEGFNLLNASLTSIRESPLIKKNVAAQQNIAKTRLKKLND